MEHVSRDTQCSNNTDPLFPDFTEDPRPLADTGSLVSAPPAARLRLAVREQVQLRPVHLDALVSQDHQVRTVWAYVEELDLTALYAPIKAVHGRPGRAATDPKILLALWMFATLQGVGSARALERLCEEHVAYQWLCGGVDVNYHTLSDFRVKHEAALNALLTQGVAVLMAEGLVTLQRVAHDGMRVRASAGAASGRRQPALRRCVKEAIAQLRTLRQELDEDPGATQRRQQAAQQRAATERLQRVRTAYRRWPEMAAKRKPEDKAEARVSTTDPDATVMKMADGGFRPAYNVQFATDTATQVVVGVDVITSGSDQGQMVPVVDQLVERYDQAPREVLVDGGFTKIEDIERLAEADRNCVVFAPVPKPRVEGIDRFLPKPEDSEVTAAWRCRMATEAAKEIYKQRAATAECVNALARNRGLQQFPVRGRRKVRAIALLYALVHNLLRTVTLRKLAVQAA